MRTLFAVLSVSLPGFLAVLGPSLAAQAPRLLVSGYSSETVHVFALDGSPLGDLGPGSVPGAQSLRYGPDGDLYVCAEELDQVLRFDGVTGAPLGAFVSDDPMTPQDETGGLHGPTSAVFGPDGMLYVASFPDDAVLRYDGTTGAYVDDFIPSGTGAINGPDAGMDFGPDGHLYIPSFENHRVLRYDGKSGAPLGAFFPVSLDLRNPRCLRWRGDGLLYVTSWGNNRVLRYDLDGTLVGVFATVTRPSGLAFAPGGDVWVTSDQTNRVTGFDGETGAALGLLVDGPAHGVVGATYLEFMPDPELHLRRPWPGVAGQLDTIAIANATPGGQVWIALGFDTTSIPTGCPGAWLGVLPAAIVPVTVDATGRLEIAAFVDASASGATLVLQAFDPVGACLSNLVVTTFE